MEVPFLQGEEPPLMRLRRLPKNFHLIARSSLPELPESARVKLATMKVIEELRKSFTVEQACALAGTPRRHLLPLARAPQARPSRPERRPRRQPTPAPRASARGAPARHRSGTEATAPRQSEAGGDTGG